MKEKLDDIKGVIRTLFFVGPIDPATFYWCACPKQGKCERSCICVLVVSILPLSMILIFEFRIVPTVWYFVVFILSQLWHVRE